MSEVTSNVSVSVPVPVNGSHAPATPNTSSRAAPPSRPATEVRIDDGNRLQATVRSDVLEREFPPSLGSAGFRQMMSGFLGCSTGVPLTRDCGGGAAWETVWAFTGGNGPAVARAEGPPAGV